VFAAPAARAPAPVRLPGTRRLPSRSRTGDGTAIGRPVPVDSHATKVAPVDELAMAPSFCEKIRSPATRVSTARAPADRPARIARAREPSGSDQPAPL